MALTLADFDYRLPSELIAQHPAPRRQDSRLMVVDRASQTWQHRIFAELPAILDHHDFLVLNDTRVFPARLHGRKAGGGGQVELLLHNPPELLDQGSAPHTARARATYRSHGLKAGQVLHFKGGLEGKIMEIMGAGVAEVQFRTPAGEVVQAVLAQGEMPLPLYPPDPGNRR